MLAPRSILDREVEWVVVIDMVRRERRCPCRTQEEKELEDGKDGDGTKVEERVC